MPSWIACSRASLACWVASRRRRASAVCGEPRHLLLQTSHVAGGQLSAVRQQRALRVVCPELPLQRGRPGLQLQPASREQRLACVSFQQARVRCCRRLQFRLDPGGFVGKGGKRLPYLGTTRCASEGLTVRFRQTRCRLRELTIYRRAPLFQRIDAVRHQNGRRVFRRRLQRLESGRSLRRPAREVQRRHAPARRRLELGERLLVQVVDTGLRVVIQVRILRRLDQTLFDRFYRRRRLTRRRLRRRPSRSPQGEHRNAPRRDSGIRFRIHVSNTPVPKTSAAPTKNHLGSRDLT